MPMFDGFFVLFSLCCLLLLLLFLFLYLVGWLFFVDHLSMIPYIAHMIFFFSQTVDLAKQMLIDFKIDCPERKIMKNVTKSIKNKKHKKHKKQNK